MFTHRTTHLGCLSGARHYQKLSRSRFSSSSWGSGRDWFADQSLAWGLEPCERSWLVLCVSCVSKSRKTLLGVGCHWRDGDLALFISPCLRYYDKLWGQCVSWFGFPHSRLCDKDLSVNSLSGQWCQVSETRRNKSTKGRLYYQISYLQATGV